LTSCKQQPLLDTPVEIVLKQVTPNRHIKEIAMKTMIYKGLLGAALAVAGLVASAGTIVGSAHDFKAVAAANGQVCVACHAPHNATVLADAPLWNHNLSTATYTLYSSSTMQAVAGQPGGVSKLCLSCHDGTVAINSFGGVTATTGFLVGAANLGTSLANDHPIGITYDAALVAADGALNPITTAVTIGETTKTKVGTIASNMLYGTGVNANKMECASCHDVHNTFTVANTAMVKTSNAALCTTCHAK
jgi:predicted CXXCH cytochrome family protein